MLFFSVPSIPSFSLSSLSIYTYFQSLERLFIPLCECESLLNFVHCVVFEHTHTHIHISPVVVCVKHFRLSCARARARWVVACYFFLLDCFLLLAALRVKSKNEDETNSNKQLSINTNTTTKTTTKVNFLNFGVSSPSSCLALCVFYFLLFKFPIPSTENLFNLILKAKMPHIFYIKSAPKWF